MSYFEYSKQAMELVEYYSEEAAYEAEQRMFESLDIGDVKNASIWLSVNYELENYEHFQYRTYH